eukprot:CAMPEP_0118702796 /NCGR_PEP_ID=MMETSP0800-20121206/18119_1 /TAXON_ID=210618 ORGANISM="Striatella unipunctata, Strain CCMP2910" /NCGR_SAMPLE_ID=MMETSP0800 /ASSEMBLY_ACC=CAM_ASM_000638 /LENGTH=343 /DNA_ID=CAMNT_0006604095 /DNA_START=182 /DNA_END=1214 /DNA_ORIENTATION=-
MDGDTIAVISFGSVHIYKKDGTSWRKIKRFDGLGQSPVSMEKNKVYVGDESNKKVVVFTMVVDDNNNENNNNWIQEDILSDATMFGLNLAVSEQTLIVAAVGSDGYGSAFSYNDNSNNNKNEKKKDVAKMLELDIAPRNDYNAARSMGFHGKNLVFGGNNNLYLFVQSNDGSWRQSDRIELTRALVTMSDPLYKDTVVVGVDPPLYPFGRGGSVIVYSIKNGKFSKQQNIVGLLGNNFGLSVGLSENVLVVGSVGEVYVYERSSWSSKQGFVFKQKIKAENSKRTDTSLFGQNVVVDGDESILVGAYLRDETEGSAYVFSRKDNGKWTQDQELTGDESLVQYG